MAIPCLWFLLCHLAIGLQLPNKSCMRRGRILPIVPLRPHKVPHRLSAESPVHARHPPRPRESTCLPNDVDPCLRVGELRNRCWWTAARAPLSLGCWVCGRRPSGDCTQSSDFAEGIEVVERSQPVVNRMSKKLKLILEVFPKWWPSIDINHVPLVNQIGSLIPRSVR